MDVKTQMMGLNFGLECHGEFEDKQIGEMNIFIENLKLGDICLI